MRRYNKNLKEVLLNTTEHPEITLNQAMGWAAEIASAMAFVHQYGVVHLDLKPLNVLMDAVPAGPQNGYRLRAVVTDFGVRGFARVGIRVQLNLRSTQLLSDKISRIQRDLCAAWNSPPLPP